MHKSRLGGVIIDCQVDDLEAAGGFWSRALGRSARVSADPADVNYVALSGSTTELEVEVQKVDHPSRVHLDIETDDIEAEVSRLEGIGARKVSDIRDWVVMEAPTGHRFCVVSVQRERFDEEANRWE